MRSLRYWVCTSVCIGTWLMKFSFIWNENQIVAVSSNYQITFIILEMFRMNGKFAYVKKIALAFWRKIFKYLFKWLGMRSMNLKLENTIEFRIVISTKHYQKNEMKHKLEKAMYLKEKKWNIHIKKDMILRSFSFVVLWLNQYTDYRWSHCALVSDDVVQSMKFKLNRTYICHYVIFFRLMASYQCKNKIKFHEKFL